MQVLRNFAQRLFGRWADDPNDQQYYVKIFFSILSGIVCASGGQAYAGIRGLMLGVLMYGLTLYIIVYLLEIDPVDIGGRQKLITNSLPSFLLLWVVLWTIFYGFTLPPSIIDNLSHSLLGTFL